MTEPAQNYENAVRIWAARKLEVDPETIASVRIEGNGGWGGTDVTPGDPGEFAITAIFADGSCRNIIDFTRNPDGRRGVYSGQSWEFSALLREILEVEG